MNFHSIAEHLEKEYKDVFLQAEIYATLKEMGGKKYEDAMLNLYDVLYTAQHEQKPVEKIVGQDWDAFYQDYFSDYKLQDYFKDFPHRVFGIVRWVLILETLVLGADLLSGQTLNLIDISPYLLGALIGLIMVPIGNYFIYPFVKSRRLSADGFYGIILGMFLLFLTLSLIFLNHFRIPLSFPWVYGLSMTYFLLYSAYNGWKNYQKYGTWRDLEREDLKRDLKNERKASFLVQVKMQLLKSYAKGYQKQKKKGLSSAEYYDKRVRSLRREKKIINHLFFWVCLILSPFMIYVFLTNDFFNFLIFCSIIALVEWPIYHWIKKTSRETTQMKDLLYQDSAPYREDLDTYFKECGFETD